MRRNLILLGGTIILATLSSCNQNKVYSKTLFYLDTYVDVSITCNDKSHLSKIEEIYKDVNIVADNFESHNGKSVYDLNQNRELEVSDTLKALINYSIELTEKTNGYYNPLIGRLANKWKESIKINEVLDSSIISEELDIMNNSSIIVDGNIIKLIGDADLDLGGIAKGYATELVHQYLIDNNIEEYLINSGESNILVGKRNKGYTVGLSKPFVDTNNTKDLYATLKLTDKSIATSSPAHQSFELDGKLYHHIISPFTGTPINNFASVNVICDNSMYADAYSTAIFVMDLDTAKKFADDNNIDVILCDKNEIIYQKLGEEIEKV